MEKLGGMWGGGEDKTKGRVDLHTTVEHAVAFGLY